MIFEATRVWTTDSVDLHMGKQDAATGDLWVATNVVFEKLHEHQLMPAAQLQLDRASAQALIDALWRANVRPSGVHETEGERSAMTKHIDSLSKIVDRTFGLLERAP